MRPRLRGAAAALAVLLSAAIAPGAASPAQALRPQARPAAGTTTVFSLVPAPGHPAYVFVHRNGRVYAGTYTSGDRQPSRVFEWTRDGTLLRSWQVPHQHLDADHGVQVANQTADGKLVLLESSTRSILTLDPRTGRFRHIATFPAGVVPDYATWGPHNLFVTDYSDDGGVWRVLRDGRVRKWFTSPALDGVAGFGTTGLAYRPRQHDFLIDQATVGDGSAAPDQGHLYELPIRRNGRPGTLHTLWTSRPNELPDGFGIARSGHVYVATAGLSEQVVELGAHGAEIQRFGTAMTGANGSAIPFDTPCSATFLGRSIMVANQSAIQGDASHEAILRVAVDDRGVAPHLPRGAHLR